MTVRDLYICSYDEQKFIIFEVGGTKLCYKGSLADCPKELLYREVHKYRGIDFNEMEVLLL